MAFIVSSHTCMHTLYPFQFRSELFPRIWGGQRLHTLFGKGTHKAGNYGESWEISAFESHDSIVSNGFLAGNTLTELVEVYMGALVGESVFEKYGNTFPLLVKFIDASQNLSLQVHPDDKLARQRHQSFGKSEMWYVVDASPESRIFAGFNKETCPAEVHDAINNNSLEHLLHSGVVVPGDVFHIKPGTVHAIGAGVLLAEIQQASDITYRLYDWGRIDDAGKLRELHIEAAIDAIHYGKADHFSLPYRPQSNFRTKLVADNNFTVNLITFDKPFEADYYSLDSFVVLVCVQGQLQLRYSDGQLQLNCGEVVLIPAEFADVELLPEKGTCKVLETYIDC